ncbi:MAG: electron transfer flavoprotein subunit alpha/FixB family protein [Halieaceae bacterium]|nr:electron transfer flavoprotein subunit alpha/FixB family protein [Halieaceae bacterium]
MTNDVNVVSLVTTSVVAERVVAPGSPLVRDISIHLDAIEERFKVTSRPSAEGPRLEDADIIVSGGRGLGSADNYALIRELASELGGLPGASRVIVDEGWVDSSHQVGLTGKITRPGLYLAAGISGASQHMAGCSAAKTIVAINKDQDASIYRYARYGIVADCLEVLPELIKAAKV